MTQPLINILSGVRYSKAVASPRVAHGCGFCLADLRYYHRHSMIAFRWIGIHCILPRWTFASDTSLARHLGYDIPNTSPFRHVNPSKSPLIAQLENRAFAQFLVLEQIDSPTGPP
jgi:hypothetical protein